ncbi:MAG: chromosomal replication initiator protein DnaA [Muribaculaceae bacterium]|nr:chromosomal replication initiator protein DnaA [Muribaculaceae bacterium]
MSEDYQIKWGKCQEFIRDVIGENRFNIWFGKTRALSFADDTLTIEVPTHYYYEQYEDVFYNVLSSAIRKVFGEDARLNYRVRMIDSPSGEVTLPHSGKSKVVDSRLDRATVRGTSANVNGGSSQLPSFNSQLNPSLNFENYCVGESNRLANTIAQAIADKPRNSDFNPFFLYGDVGVGKTHLVEAIGIRVRERNAMAKVYYTTARQFQHLYAEATISKKVPDFINWFMMMDLLIIDDLQEISNKVKTSEVLFPIFNHLHQSGKQLVFACDRPPMELDGIADRLIDRFKWGLTEKLPRPDASLRKQILKYKARKNGLDLPENVIDYIACNAVNSVRELEGIVMGMLTRSISLNVPITVQLAEEVVKNTVKVETRKPVNFDMIVEATAEVYDINPDVIFSKSRVRDIADARQVIMYLCNKLTSLSSTAIGQKLNRQHATVLHGIATIKDRLSVTPEFSRILDAIETNVLS